MIGMNKYSCIYQSHKYIITRLLQVLGGARLLGEERVSGDLERIAASGIHWIAQPPPL